MFLLLLLIVFSPLENAFAQSGPSAGGGAAGGGINTDFLWRQALGGTVIGVPVVQGQTVVLALDGGTIQAFSSSGTPLWSFSARGRLSPFITRSKEGVSYICRTNGIFIAVNRSGKELWRANVEDGLSGPVVIGWDGRVFVPAGRKVFCFTASGNLLWSRGLDAGISAGPRLDRGGGFLLCLDNGDVLRFDPFGTLISRRLQSSPQILLPVNNSVLALFTDGAMLLFDLAAPGKPPVNFPKLPAQPLAAASRGGNVAAVLANGRVVHISGTDGKILWTADSHIRMQLERGIVTSGGTGTLGHTAEVHYNRQGIYVLTASGASGFTAEGRRLWFTSVRNASGIPAFDDSGILYSGGTDWVLYAWKLEDRELSQTRNPDGQVFEGRYGIGNTTRTVFADYLDDTYLRKELEAIGREIRAGRVGENESEWITFLMETAEGGLPPGAPPHMPPKIQTAQRVQALLHLSKIGSVEITPWLVRFFNRNREPLVRSAAAAAIGGIGFDPDGSAIQSFLTAVTAGRPAENEQVFLAVAAATGALCRFGGPPLFRTGTQVLNLLTDSRQPQSVQRQAKRELESLKIMRN